MKVGFLGNTNNYPFRLARAMRDLGHEVVFFVDRPRNEPRHRPESHYADIPYPYPDWIREIEPLSPKPIVMHPWTMKAVLHALETCDGVILNGLALSLGPTIHRPIIGLLTGSDLDVFANPKLLAALAAAPYRLDRYARNGLVKHVMMICKGMLFRRFIRLQRAGIGKCSLVEYAVPGLLPTGDALLDEIGIGKKRRASFMLTDIERLPWPPPRTSEIFRIFCATRLQWKRPVVGANVSPLDDKGTDVMLEGLQKFVSCSRLPVQIHLISFGADAASAEHYVKELGLADHISWHPQLSQDEFLAEMAQADVVMENFGLGGCIGMAGRDAIAMGKPLVAWGKSEVFERALGEKLPLYEARTATEICAQLQRIIDNPTEVAEHSTRARAFASRWFSARRAAEQCVAVFEEALKGNQGW